jgi:hypothetical protein
MALYTMTSGLAGTAAGAAAGWLGAHVPGESRVAAATVAGAVLAGLAAANLAGWLEKPPLQCDRETPQRWVRQGALPWALKNGAALGFGAFTRLGFALWYVVPAGAVLLGSPAAGALLWGLYGLLRGGGAVAIWVAQTRRPSFDVLWLGEQRRRAEVVTGSYLLVLGSTAFILVGT